MSFKTPKPQPEDPLIAQQRRQAEADKLNEIQKQVTADTDQFVRLFGTRAAMDGGGMRAPILGY